MDMIQHETTLKLIKVLRKVLVQGLLALIFSTSVTAQQIDYTGTFLYGDINASLDGKIINISPILSTVQDIKLNQRKLTFVLDMGDNYKLGGKDWSYSLDLQVVAYDKDNLILQTFTLPSLDISDGSAVVGNPKEVTSLDYTNIAPFVDRFEVNVLTSLPSSAGGADASLAEGDLRLSITAEAYLGYGLKANGFSIQATKNSLKVEGFEESTTDTRLTEVRFSWGIPTSTYFESYDLEVLKLEVDKDQNIPIDWNRATRIEVEKGVQEYTITMSEGSGFYLWRVRPIGSFYEGKRADRRNYGAWNKPEYSTAELSSKFDFSGTYGLDGTFGFVTNKDNLLVLGTPILSDLFYYDQFDNDINWIHSRVFTEDNRQSETMTFANGLNQVQQVQTKLFSKQEVIGTHTAYDYSGRPAVQSLPAPVGSSSLGFKAAFFKKDGTNFFEAADFDADATIYKTASPSEFDPAIVGAGTPAHYYSEYNKGRMKDSYTPQALGFPYTRTLFESNATGRVWKQAGVGLTMRLSNIDDPAVNHNVTTQYGGVSQDEVDRLFGNEAPISSNVIDTPNSTYKVQTTDPNGVVSVSYMSKAGQVLATMINNKGSLSNLSEIDGPADQPFKVVDVLEKGKVTPFSTYSKTSKTLIVDGDVGSPARKKVGISYKITPQTFGDVCDICWTCDYHIEISILSPQYPQDAARNVKLKFDVAPIDLYPNCGTAQVEKTLADLLSGTDSDTIKTPDNDAATDIWVIATTDGNLTSIGSTPSEVNLLSGTYLIEKRVYTNNENPVTEEIYLTEREEELRLQRADDWTQTNNCCGPITTPNDIDCGTPPDICGTAELDALATDWYNDFIAPEKVANYRNHINKNHSTNAPLKSEVLGITGLSISEIKDGDDMKILIDFLCAEGYTTNELIACVEAYGGLLERNIGLAQKVVNLDTRTGKNPPLAVDKGLDFLAGVLECIGFDADGSFCKSYKQVVSFDNSAGMTAAAASGDYYIVTWYDDGVTPTPDPGGVDPASIPTGKAKYVEILDPLATPPSPINQAYKDNFKRTNCVTLAANSTGEPASTPEKVARRTCNCLQGMDAGEALPVAEQDVEGDVIDLCTTGCESNRGAFSSAIEEYVENYNIALGVLSDEIDDAGESIWQKDDGQGGYIAWKTFIEVFPGSDKECLIDAMVTQCVSQCQLEIGQSISDIVLASTCLSDCSDPGCFTTEILASSLGSRLSGIGSYNCAEDFLNSTEYRDSIQAEQLEFLKAWQWVPEFAPVAGTSIYPSPTPLTTVPNYPDVKTDEQMQSEMIEFFYSSLQNNMFFRTATTTIAGGGATYPITYSSQPTGYYYIQEALPISYTDGAGVIKEVYAVTNVVWDAVGSGDLTDQSDDLIKEINVILYCNSTALLYWSYTPDGSCLPVEAYNPLSYHVELQFAKFSFDLDGSFHAVPADLACSSATINSLNVCNVEAEATLQLQVNSGTPGAKVLIEIENGVDPDPMESTYLFDKPVAWDTDVATTAVAIVDAINATQTVPGYTATENGTGLITISTSGSRELTPLGASVVFTNVSGIMNITETQAMQSCVVPLNTLLTNCSTIIPALTGLCPEGFALVSSIVPNPSLGYDLSDTEDYTDFENDLVGFWDESLTEIIKNRNNKVTTPFSAARIPDCRGHVPNGHPSSFDITFAIPGMTYYQKTKEFYFEGKPNTAYVIVGGEEIETPNATGGVDVEKKIYTISMGLVCSATESYFIGNPFRFILFSSDQEILCDSFLGRVKPPPAIEDYNELSPDLLNYNSLNPTTTFDPFTFSGAIGEIFTSISLEDETSENNVPGANGIDDHMLFLLNSTNLTAGLPYRAFARGTIGRDDAGGTILNEVGLPDEYFILNGPSSCVADCEVCLGWTKPEVKIPEFTIEIMDCATEQQEYIENRVENVLDSCFNSKIDSLKANYRRNCLENIVDEFSINYELNYGHYTLYYYDRANNLIATIPPEGVHPLTETEVDAVQAYRKDGTGTPFYPREDETLTNHHHMVTNYTYNSIKQLIQQETPDGGISYFWYNGAGQLVLSQDAQQGMDGNFSYTQYDALGRINEVGELTGYTLSNAIGPFDPATSDILDFQVIPALWQDATFPDNITGGGVATREVVNTQYTTSSTVTYMGEVQQNLRNRISKVWTDDGYTSHFSYDPHGNVEWIIQDLPEIGQRTIFYEYSLVSGNVNKVIYNEGTTEQFMHRYTYDEDNRILEAFTSTDGLTWDSDARYDYYLHGPLARTEIGEDHLQGIDNTFTLEGYLKSVNQVELYADGSKDPGRDGTYSATLDIISGTTGDNLTININTTGQPGVVNWNDKGAAQTARDVVTAINTEVSFPYKAYYKGGETNQVVIYSTTLVTTSVTGTIVNTFTDFNLATSFVKDEFAMELGYYDGDFERTGSFIGANTIHYPFSATTDISPLYNGNISYWQTNTRSGQSGTDIDPYNIKMNQYRYDKLNRIKLADFKYFDGISSYLNTDSLYDESFSYDHNGNIKRLHRHGNDMGATPNERNSNASTLKMDQLAYIYNLAGDGHVSNNKLRHLVESEVNSDPSPPSGTPLGSYGTDLGTQVADNYVYDAEGNLIEDKAEKIKISWNVINKVAQVNKYSDAALTVLDETITFEYDALGNRVMKKVEDVISGDVTTTYYVRDASGNVMGNYKKVDDVSGTTVTLEEQPIYGSSRIGMLKPNLTIYSGAGNGVISPSIGSTLLTASTSTVNKTLKELDHWLVAAKPKDNTVGGAAEVDFTTTPAVDNGILSLAMFSNVRKNVAVAENLEGEVQFKWSVNSSGGINIGFVWNKDGTFVIDKGVVLMSDAGYDSKSIIAQSLTEPNIYFIVTGNAGEMYFHTVDMGAGPTGSVIAKEQKLVGEAGSTLTYDATNNQYALAVNNKAGKLYVAVNQVDDIKLYEFDITTDGISNGITRASYNDNSVCIYPTGGGPGFCSLSTPVVTSRLDLGEMQISPTGLELALNFYHDEEHKLELFNINATTGELAPSNTIVLATETRPNVTVGTVRTNLKKAVYSIDYTADGNYIYYLQGAEKDCSSETGIKKFVCLLAPETNLQRVDLSSNDIIDVDDTYIDYPQDLNNPIFGEVRRAKDGNMYVNRDGMDKYWNPLVDGKHLLVYTTPSAADPLPLPGYLDMESGLLNFGLPLQPFKSKDLIVASNIGDRLVGKKLYELSDHLGNVRAVFSDKKIADGNNDGTLDDPEIEVLSWQDYYAFGSLMPGRSVSTGDYRYGFIGKENDNEVNGVVGGSQDHAYRSYDPRLGKYKSLDPLARDYPWNSPYAYAENDAIRSIDLEGREKHITVQEIGDNGEIKVLHYYDLGKILASGHGSLGSGHLYITRLQNKNITKITYHNYANKGKLNEISSFTTRRVTKNVPALWDYNKPTPPRYTWESDVQLGLKSSQKAKILGYGADLTYGAAGHFFSSNINSSGTGKKEWFKNATLNGSVGYGFGGGSISYNSKGTFSMGSNVSVFKLGLDVNPFVSSYSNSVDLSIVDVSLVEGIGGSFSFSYNPTQDTRNLYNSSILRGFVPEEHQWQLDPNDLKYQRLKSLTEQ